MQRKEARQHSNPQTPLSFLSVQRVKAEAAEAAAKMLEELQKKNQEMLEQKDKSYQEHIKQLTEKMEEERIRMREEQDRILALKLQVCSYPVLNFRFFLFRSIVPDHKNWQGDHEATQKILDILILTPVCLPDLSAGPVCWPCLIIKFLLALLPHQ